MDSCVEVSQSEYDDQGGPKALQNADVSGRIEHFNVLADGNNAPKDLEAKREHVADLHSKISELVKMGSIETAPTHALFSIVSRILDESIEKKNEDIPQRVASVLKLVIQEIEHRVSKQVENMKKQSNLYKSREGKYHTKIRALETLATGTTEENEIVMKQLQQMKIEKSITEEKKKLVEQDLISLRKENNEFESQILALNEALTLAKISYERTLSDYEATAQETKDQLHKKIVELERCLVDSNKKAKELEDSTESKYMLWRRREQGYKSFMDSHSTSLKDLRMTSDSIKQEVFKIRNTYAEEFHHFGMNLQCLIDAAQNYHTVLEENRKLYNEVQDLKGNIRVYCRIRPFLSGQNAKQTTIQYIGDNGELVVMNPLKPGKDSHRLFKFNKAFGPATTQEEVFRDTQPLIRSVLDGYNVCIFAYGQTGSGKTYTMSGPNVTSVIDWGVNYRALNDLFTISQNRKSSFLYEIGVQMVEIYNEQVRDLLRNETTQKRLGIWSTAQPNGLAVPDASMHPVKSTADVLELMNIGLMNRAVGATALNERSSRSHSILTVHVRGTDLETNAILRGCLHLVDLAGSERVDRSEATGDRLREAQHINKSLSALGDVIFALAQKSNHVPYRNSKLTQVLQSSLGGQAKTLMFVQLNPDVESYSETISTLKFAERVSGVELGAARTNKEARGVRELMEQVASLKDAVSQKDDEIQRLRSINANGNSSARHGVSSPKHGSPSPRRHSIGAQPRNKFSGERNSSDRDNSSEYSDKNSGGSHQSADDFKHRKDFFRSASSVSEDFTGSKHEEDADVELLGIGEDDSDERLSDISDGVLSMGTETDASTNSIVEYTLFPESGKQPGSEATTERPTSVAAKIPRPPAKHVQAKPSLSKSSSKIPSAKRAASSSSSSGSLSATRPPRRWQ